MRQLQGSTIEGFSEIIHTRSTVRVVVLQSGVL
jgi:hypothetical protein